MIDRQGRELDGAKNAIAHLLNSQIQQPRVDEALSRFIMEEACYDRLKIKPKDRPKPLIPDGGGQYYYINDLGRKTYVRKA